MANSGTIGEICNTDVADLRFDLLVHELIEVPYSVNIELSFREEKMTKRLTKGLKAVLLFVCLYRTSSDVLEAQALDS